MQERKNFILSGRSCETSKCVTEDDNINKTKAAYSLDTKTKHLGFLIFSLTLSVVCDSETSLLLVKSGLDIIILTTNNYEETTQQCKNERTSFYHE